MKVADFGFARSLPAASLAETLCGSPLYMAPEILRYEKYDAKADLWSIGAVTFEMVVGKPPFRASNHVELLRRIEKNEDRIRFPDERSEATWLRDVEKRREAGEVVTADQEKRGPTPVAEDIKALVRGLLKRKAIERMSFEDFFGSSVVLDARPQAAETNKSVQPSPTAEPPARESLASRSSLRPVSPPRPTPGPALPMQDPSPARVQAPPPMQALPPLPKFAPKYVVGREERADRGDKAQAVPQQSKPASQATAGSSAVQQKPESKTSGIGAQLKDPRTPKHATASSPSPSPSPAAELSDEDSQYVMVEKRSIEINALADELGQSPNSQRPSQPLAAQAQGAVSAAVRLARRPSRLTRLSSGFSAAATIGENSGTPQNVGSPTDRIGPSSPRSAQSGPSNFARDLPSPPPAVGTPGSRDTSATSALSSSPSAPFALPAGVRRQSFIGRKASSSGAGIPKLADVKKETSTSPANQPVAASAPSQSSALARTLASASQKMFGVPSGLSLLGAAALMRTAAPVVARMMPLPVADPTSTSPPLKSGQAYASSVAAKIKSGESELLQRLDDLSQKAFVLSEFADSKMTGVDASSSANNEGGNASSLVEQYAAALARQRSSSMSSSAASGLGFIDPVLDVNNANESLAVYIRGLGFLQKGIELVRSFVESRSVSSASAYSVSAEVNDAVHYLRKRFNVTFEKAEIARSRTVAAPGSTSANRHSSSPSSGSSTSPPPLAASTVNRLIYDKAMEIARAAALDELENNHKTVTINAIGSSPDVNATGAAPPGAPSSSSPNATSQTAQWDIHACLLAYETAGIMLSSLLETTVTSSQVEETAALTVEPCKYLVPHLPNKNVIPALLHSNRAC